MKKILAALLVLLLAVSCDPFKEPAEPATEEEMALIALAQASSEIASDRFPDAFVRHEDWNGFGSMRLKETVTIEETGITITHAKGKMTGRPDNADMELEMEFTTSDGVAHRLRVEQRYLNMEHGIPGVSRFWLDGRCLFLAPSYTR